MIIDLPSTSAKEVSKKLLQLRNDVGAMAMGRVLTLLVVTDDTGSDEAIRAANDATRQHPARIIVVVRANRRGANRLDAQVRVGGDAGASEIVVLRLYGELADQAASVVTALLLPDSPIVGWWPHDPPHDVAGSPLGQIAHRRITDASGCAKPRTELRRRAKHYQPGDTDLSWTRLTRWRGLLAATLDQPPYEDVTAATVSGDADSPSTDLMAGWLADALQVPVKVARTAAGTGLVAVRLERASGPVDLVATRAGSAEQVGTLSQAGQPTRQVPLPDSTLPELLAAELRRLDADEVYASAVRDGIPRVGRSTTTHSEAVRKGKAPEEPAELAETHHPELSTKALEGAPAPSERVEGTALDERIHQGLAEFARGSVRIAEDTPSVAAAVATAVDAVVQRAVAERGVAHLVVTGGSLGTATVGALADLSPDPQTWEHVHVWWGDERFVPEGDPDRNVQQAVDAGLDRLPLAPGHVHAVPAGADEADLPQAAVSYAATLAEHAPEGASVPVPEFDVLLLGVGPDSHVASIFPGREELLVTDRTTVPVTDSPKPPPLRVSLTVPAIRRAKRVWFTVAGADKADAVRAARAEREDPQVPASWPQGTLETVWWVDRAVADGAGIEG